jgi:hypothetical protein
MTKILLLTVAGIVGVHAHAVWRRGTVEGFSLFLYWMPVLALVVYLLVAAVSYRGHGAPWAVRVAAVYGGAMVACLSSADVSVADGWGLLWAELGVAGLAMATAWLAMVSRRERGVVPGALVALGGLMAAVAWTRLVWIKYTMLGESRMDLGNTVVWTIEWTACLVVGAVLTLASQWTRLATRAAVTEERDE